MIIDMHTHIGDLRAPGEEDRETVTVKNLIQRLDDEGTDKAVVMPMGVTPESTKAPFLFNSLSSVTAQLEAAAGRQDRLILFGNLDPRLAYLGNLEPHQVENPPVTDFSPFLERFKNMGCVGIGEVTANLPMDDSRVINMFRQCGDWGMPVLFHGTGPGAGVYGLFDEVGLPRLERLLKEVPNTTVIGHAPGFWSEITGDITLKEKFVYPTGPVEKEGSLQRLLRTYPNLYADISAMSGYTAISRDKDYGIKFMNEFQDRVIYGTDVCYGDMKGRMPHLSYLRELLAGKLISQKVFNKIVGENAQRILNL